MKRKFVAKKRSLFALLAACLLFLLTACTGTGPVKSLRARSLYGQQELTLPIESRDANPGDAQAMPFNSGMTTDEMYDLVENLGYRLQKGGRGFLISVPNAEDDSFVEYYGICHMLDDHFIFSDMKLIAVYDVSDEKGIQTVEFLFPLHCLVDPKFVNYYDGIYTGQEYEVSEGLDYFYEFYQKAGWLNVEKGENWIQINSFKAEPKGDYKLYNRDIPFPIRICFDKEDDKFYITLQAIQK